MSDVRVRNKKTNEEKVVPLKVYESLKHIYSLVGDSGESVDQDVKKKEELSQNVAHAESSEQLPTVVVEDGIVTEIEVKDVSVRRELEAEYSTLTGGKKPDGRLSDQKLKAKIDELKNAANEGK